MKINKKINKQTNKQFNLSLCHAYPLSSIIGQNRFLGRHSPKSPKCQPISMKFGRELLLHILWVEFYPDRCLGGNRPNDADFLFRRDAIA